MASQVTLRNTITLLFCCFLIFCTVTWNMPASAIRASVTDWSQHIMMPFGLDQQWAMFATLGGEGSKIQIQKTYTSGEVNLEPTPLSEQVGYIPTAMHKLYFNLASSKGGPLVTEFLQSLCREDSDAAHLQSVSFLHQSLPIAHSGIWLNAGGKDEQPVQTKVIVDKTVQCHP